MKKLRARSFLLLLLLLTTYAQAGEEEIDFLARFPTQSESDRVRSISILQGRVFSEGSEQDWLKLGVIAEDKEPDCKRLKTVREIDVFYPTLERENSKGFPSVRPFTENVHQGEQSMVVQPPSSTRDDLRLAMADTNLKIRQLATSSDTVVKIEAKEFTTCRHKADTSTEASSSRINTAAKVSIRYPHYRSDNSEMAGPSALKAGRKKMGFNRHNPIFLEIITSKNLLNEMIPIEDRDYRISDKTKSTLKGMMSKNNEPSKNNAGEEENLPHSSAKQNAQDPKPILNKASTGLEKHSLEMRLKSSKINIVKNNYMHKERARDCPSNIKISEKGKAPVGSSSEKYIKTENISTAFLKDLRSFDNLKTEKSNRFELKKTFEEEIIRLIDPKTQALPSDLIIAYKSRVQALQNNDRKVSMLKILGIFENHIKSSKNFCIKHHQIRSFLDVNNINFIIKAKNLQSDKSINCYNKYKKELRNKFETIKFKNLLESFANNHMIKLFPEWELNNYPRTQGENFFIENQMNALQFYSSIFGNIRVNEFSVYNLKIKGSSELIELSKTRQDIEVIVARFNEILHSDRYLSSVFSMYNEI
ncbi:hypothetical protein PPACK8108_LOCUS25734 [Phakopsora pachyrhizi]|uniref:Uncharacterized protein n=1 Tax=Phakopsora pachyrhizi TaxID=170000 RepID=A0AAV0BXV4_PHAPC|nr:hypothetical protein PPACK8108_LOCUS25734 [Phakopsora pachyrhizi]